jgi:hypothetical protein
LFCRLYAHNGSFLAQHGSIIVAGLEKHAVDMDKVAFVGLS